MPSHRRPLSSRHPSIPRSRRSLALLATPAVIAAMTVTVPALAGTSLLGGGGTAPSASAARARAHTASTCFTVVSHHHRVRECLIAGPRGSRGPRGFTGVPGAKGAAGPKGATGLTGKAGTAGKTGSRGERGEQGPAGTARAYALIQPVSPTQVNVIVPQSFDIAGLTETSASGSTSGGIYCITPGANVNPATEVAAATPEVSYSAAGAPGVVAVNAQHQHCPANAFEVDTYAPGNLSTPTTGYAFTIVMP